MPGRCASFEEKPKLNQEIKIPRSNLIAKCDQNLNGEIAENDFENYANKLITEESFDWDDVILFINGKVQNLIFRLLKRISNFGNINWKLTKTY
ncbi:hypothetical protein P700755_001756 [Psychroflexus torquis ATCC 700755]|uniref:Uncharacterized protein n=1 Tax=Psychroflexus torquis (strain ATCC 700755 / CIP 106069 / ACAM 623) TaxID=313595 RepID=K4IT08_PSYTT|nr:hypothetical protein P700755_001756 [Psychroflexus torquis ATCC 700755]